MVMKLPWFTTFLLISPATWSDVNTEGWRSAASGGEVQWLPMVVASPNGDGAWKKMRVQMREW